MPVIRRAVIDIGTNSVKLLVGDVGDGAVQPVFEDSKQTRLGEGFYEAHRLQPSNIAKTAQAVKSFVTQARQLNAVSTRVIATSAARDAVNGNELVSAIAHATELKVEIISGEMEADLAFRGVTTVPELAREPLLLLDVGGGSTEFILGCAEQKDYRGSFPLGALRLLEKLPPGDPPAPRELAACRQWVSDFLKREVLPHLQPALTSQTTANSRHRPVQLVGTGGTATILARMEGELGIFDRDRIEGMSLPLASLRVRIERLWALPLAARKEIVGLPPKRADVILTGAVIYEGVMESLGFERLRVTTRGLRFAAMMDPR